MLGKPAGAFAGLWGPGEERCPQHTGVPGQHCPEDARWEPCVSWLPAGRSAGLPDLAAPPDVGWGKKGLLERCKVQGLAVDWPRSPWQNKESLCGSGSAHRARLGRRHRSCVCERLQPRSHRELGWVSGPDPWSGAGAGLSLLPRPRQLCLHGWML